MKWRHILEEQPVDGEKIIHLDRPYDDGYYPMAMRKYEQKCSWTDQLQFCENWGCPKPDFWWMPASEFPFPDKVKTD